MPSHYLNQWWLDYSCIYALLSLNELTVLALMFCYQIIPCICFVQLTWRSRINSTDLDRDMPALPNESDMVRLHQHVQFQTISSMHSTENARKPQILPAALSKWHQKEETHRPWPKSNQLYGWSGYISMQNFRPFLLCVPKNMPGNLSGWTAGWIYGWTERGLVGWSSGLWMDRGTKGQTAWKHNALST